MLTSEQLHAIPINNEALLLMPESVARENKVLAVSLDDDTLKLVLPAIADAERCLLEEKLRFILNRSFTYDTGEADDLIPVIDLHYTAAYSTIQNCDRTFRKRCPKHWAELRETDEPKTRWCSTCERTVTFCLTDKDVDRLSRAGKCVAFRDGPSHTDTLGLLESAE